MTGLLAQLIDPSASIGIDAILPAWLLLVGTLASIITAVGVAVVGIYRWVLKPILAKLEQLRAEVRSWGSMADKVEVRSPEWDRASQQLAEAVKVLAEVSRSLVNVQHDISEIRSQVLLDGGDSLKDQVVAQRLRGDERHAELDVRLDRIESVLNAQDVQYERDHQRDD